MSNPKCKCTEGIGPRNCLPNFSKSISEKVSNTLKEENKNLEVEMKKIKEEKEACERN